MYRRSTRTQPIVKSLCDYKAVVAVVAGVSAACVPNTATGNAFMLDIHCGDTEINLMPRHSVPSIVTIHHKHTHAPQR